MEKVKKILINTLFVNLVCGLITMGYFILFSKQYSKYSLTGANIIGVYYILKSAILYTKMQQDKLNSLSDIKEIVKDEPKKIIPRRKNKKEEGK